MKGFPNKRIFYRLCTITWNENIFTALYIIVDNNYLLIIYCESTVIETVLAHLLSWNTGRELNIKLQSYSLREGSGLTNALQIAVKLLLMRLLTDDRWTPSKLSGLNVIHEAASGTNNLRFDFFLLRRALNIETMALQKECRKHLHTTTAQRKWKCAYILINKWKGQFRSSLSNLEYFLPI